MSASSDSEQDSSGSGSDEDGHFGQRQPQQQQAEAGGVDGQQTAATVSNTLQTQQQYHTQSGELALGSNYLPFMMPSQQSGLMLPGSTGAKGHIPASSASGSSISLPVGVGHQLCYDGQQQKQQQPPRDVNGGRYTDGRADSASGQQQQSSTQVAPSLYREATQHNAATANSNMYGFDQSLASASSARFAAEYGFGQHTAKLEEIKPGAEHPPPPKKPLTPYMRFNKLMWHEVKATNPSMGVCEVSSAIGRLWRELGPEEKQRHNDDYSLDKVRYDEELKSYLKLTGLKSADLVKAKPKKAPAAVQPAAQRRPAAAPVVHQQQQGTQHQAASQAAGMNQQQQQQQQQQKMFQAAASQQQQQQQLQQQQQQQLQQQQQQQLQQQQQQQQLQALMGLPVVSGSLPIGMSVGLQSMGMLSGFPQMWASQQYPPSLMSAGQLQELYSNSGAPPPAHSQQLSNVADAQAAAAVALYRYQQSFM